MGGMGSKGHGSNQYTAFNAFRLKHGPDEPYPWRGADGVVRMVMRPPRKVVKRKPNSKPRSDKGKAHDRVRHDDSSLTDPVGPPQSWQEQQEDIQRTIEEIAKWEEHEAFKAHRASPAIVARMKRRTNELERIRYRRTVQAKRKSMLPVDRCCPICNDHKETTKQWVIVVFADGEHPICRGCYDSIRIRHFDKQATLLKSFLKTCLYSKLLEICNDVERMRMSINALG